MYPLPETTEKFIDVQLCISPEHYHPEMYDMYLDKMIHQLSGLKHPYEEGHLPYVQCPVCPRFDEFVSRRYFQVEDDITEFTITVSFPNETQLKIYVKEQKPDRETIQIHFQVEVSVVHTSYVAMKRPVKLQEYILSWMNSLLLELLIQSKKYQEHKEIEHMKKEIQSIMYDTFYYLRSSLY
jgi:hypothetical protein